MNFGLEKVVYKEYKKHAAIKLRILLDNIMATKWAVYLISKVRYNDKHTHITDVMVHVDNGDTVGDGTSYKREWVIEKINGKKSFYTILKDTDNKWKKGQEVIKDRVNGVDYITTKPNGSARDNLENLPEY